MKVPFLDLKAQTKEIKSACDASLSRQLERGDFILGEEVVSFERDFAAYVGSPYSVGVNSGTDALFLGLLALGIGRGDEVILPAYTYIASAFAISYTGAKPVFVDIDPGTFNIDPLKIEKAVTKRTKAVMPVHLYGQSADMDGILRIARKYRLSVIEDTAQAHGASCRVTDNRGQRTEKTAGNIGDLGAFSFYPTKNLGAFGDAGMVVTSDEKLYRKLLKLRDYGRVTRYEHDSLGYNSRLDSMQALFLNIKLKRLDSWNRKRRKAADYYREFLKDNPEIILPLEAGYGKHVYHIFAVLVRNRDRVLEGLKKTGVSAMVHYPVPLHLQKVYGFLGYKKGDCPVSENVCSRVLCLPMHPHLTKDKADFVCRQLKRLVKNG